MKDPYDTLGVPPTATPDEIARAYRQRLREHHPDLRQGVGHTSDAELQQVLAAYAALRGRPRRTRPGAVPVPVRVRRAPQPAARPETTPPLRAGPVHWHRAH